MQTFGTLVQAGLVFCALLLIVGFIATIAAIANKSFPAAESAVKKTAGNHEGFGAALDAASWKDVDEEDRYDGPVLPSGAVAAAIASRWRSLRQNESNYGRMTDFALAGGSDFHSRH